MSDSPRDPTDVRDERLAARLETEPLDEVTRARLVRTAMAATAETTTTSQPSRWSARTRWLAVAAALVVVLAVGLAVVLRDNSGSEPTAARAPKTGASESGSRSAADSPELDQNFSTDSGIRPLGDLGDVGSNPKLRRAVSAAGADAPSASPLSERSAQAAATSAAAAPCVIKPRGTIVATGSGTAQGETVAVYVVERPNGSRVAVTVGPNCTVGKPVKL
jgi:hypothetical protein